MAKMKIEADCYADFEIAMQEEVSACKRAVYAGAGVFSDALRASVLALPVDSPEYRRNIGQNPINVISETLKNELADSIGISKIEVDDNGAVTNAISFNGYSSIKTDAYPNGIPMQMVARSIESGSSVRRKFPFIRNTFNKNKSAIEAAIKNELEKVIPD